MENIKVVVIIQARLGSTRLPGKVLKQVAGRSLLSYQLERILLCKLVDQIVIATTTFDEDDKIEWFCKENGITCFRGSSEDVLSRYFGAAKLTDADIIVRITSDCPLMDPKLIDDVICFYLKHYDELDYVTNTLERTYPRGMDVEAFSYLALEKAMTYAVKSFEREHVTPYFYNHPELFRLASIVGDEDLSCYRFTVDTKEDFELIKHLIMAVYSKNSNYTLQDLIIAMREHPDWFLLNAHIEQKK